MTKKRFGKLAPQQEANLTCADLLRPVEEEIGCGYMLWPDGGFYNGSVKTRLEGVLVTWMADVPALEQAARTGCNVVVCHEPLFAEEKNEEPPYRWLTPDPGVATPPWHPNSKKRMLIAKRNLTVLQCHYGLDRFSHFKATNAAFGLTTPCYDHGWESVFELPQAVTVGSLAARLKQRLKIKGTVRVVGDLRRRVRRVMNLWGGLGLKANLYWVRQGIQHGAEVGICGEMDEAFMHFATDAGLALIETSHQLSEEIGMRCYADCLRRLYPRLRVRTYLPGRPYKTL
jgi:putative NIF3 family GTP cyclohydrolase 1 type 2